MSTDSFSVPLFVTYANPRIFRDAVSIIIYYFRSLLNELWEDPLEDALQ